MGLSESERRELEKLRREVLREKIKTAQALGWSTFGTHLLCGASLEFAEISEDDGLPLWERRVDRLDDNCDYLNEV